MGVDISMTFGWGVHLTSEEVESWLGPDDEGGNWEGLETLLKDYPELSFDWAGNAWIGEDFGFVIYIRDSTKSFDRGREAQAGVYRASKTLLSVKDSAYLRKVVETVLGKPRKIEWLVTVGVS